MNDHLVRALVVLVLVACGAWVVSRTEWAEVELPTPASGEAARNPLYATQRLVRGLGAEVAAPSNLGRLPPRRATLLLDSMHWALFPERVRELRQWVEDGGNLVVEAGRLSSPHFKGWVPMDLHGPARHEDVDDGDPDGEDTRAHPPADIASSPLLDRLRTFSCHEASEPDAVSPGYPDANRRFEACSRSGLESSLRTLREPMWAVSRPSGLLMARVAVGQGSVTAVSVSRFFENESVLKGDNALLIVAALQARPGASLWFVTEESRLSFLRWLWAQAWVVVLLGLLAAGLAAWRHGVRFGPLAPAPAPGRRSVGEQIAGTAQFLRRHGGLALHAAQLRALEAAARSRLRGYEAMPRAARAQAIAQATRLEMRALDAAMQSLTRRPLDLPPVLELLETARRLLLQAPPTPK